MSKTLYNEGRVVGYSAYEAYVKGYIENSDGNGTPASEREWLSSSLASGSSMILKIAANTSAGVHDYPLPSNSNLVAPNNITGSLFLGNCEFNGNWAIKITDYGELIPNNSTSSPSNGNVPYDTNATNIHKSQILQFVKIEDGIIYQSGNWSNNTTSATPTKNLEADFKDYKTPTVRLKFSEEIKSDICILLTGFTDLEVVKGVTGLDSSIDTASPQNGDFIGPATFPWGAKIIFSQPNNTSYILQDGIVSGSGNVIITPNHEDGTTSIEVKNAITPGAYYEFEALQDQTKYDLYNFLELENITNYLGSNVIIGQNPAEHGGTTYIGALTCVSAISNGPIHSPIWVERQNDAFGTIGLNLNLNAGYGIKIDKTSETWNIYVSDDKSNYKQLTKSKYDYDDDHDDDPGDYKLLWAHGFSSYDKLGAKLNNSESDIDIRIQVTTKYDDTDKKTIADKVYIIINGSKKVGSDPIYLGSDKLYSGDSTNDYINEFKFRHTASIDGETPKDGYTIYGYDSKIVGIKFINKEFFPYPDEYPDLKINLTKLNGKSSTSSERYPTLNADTQQVGIWNVGGGIKRASWAAYCTLSQADSQTTISDAPNPKPDLLWINAISYGDGYNSQFFKYPSNELTGSAVTSNHLNLSISGYYQY